jgi:uncharacterized membrane protein
MKLRALLTLCIFLGLLLLSSQASCYTGRVQYDVQIRADSSAVWKVTQVTDLNASVDTQDAFQQRVENLVDAAGNRVDRDMSVDPDSLQMDIVISWESQSKTIVSSFDWSNFSLVDANKITIGDVFEVPDFFTQLYGDGDLHVVYPLNYSVETVSPAPNQRDDSQLSLIWLRTQDFVNGKHNIVLQAGEAIPSPTIPPTTSPTPLKDTGGNTELVWMTAISGVAACILFASFLAFRRIKRANKNDHSDAPFSGLQIESDEEKILRIVSSSGGQANQTLIGEQCKFSKAKTSQLLTLLEQKHAVRRYKRGRDKIVVLTAKGEGS